MRRRAAAALSSALLASAFARAAPASEGLHAAHFQPVAPVAAGTLTATYFGTSTILLDDGRDRILFDGFFSRPRLGRLLVGPVAPNPKRISWALDRADLKHVRAIFVAHAHYDHVMDAPTVAKRTHAHLVGSPSTAVVARGEGIVENRLHVVLDGARCRFGDFMVTMYETPHGTTPLPTGQEITRPLPRPAGVLDYKDGGNFSFLVEHPKARILVVPSGRLEPDTFARVEANVTFLGVAQISRSGGRDSYWREAVVGPGAQLVIPIHWDNLMRPLSKPLVPFPWPLDRFDRTRQWLRDMSRQPGRRVTVIFPRAFEPIELAGQADPGARPPVRPVGRDGACVPAAAK